VVLEVYSRVALTIIHASRKYSLTQISRFEYFTVKCVILFRYSVTVFRLLLQLQLLGIIQLQLQLQLTEAYFSVISHFSYSYLNHTEVP